MGETKKIVVESFPVDELPDKLRLGLETGRMVKITIESEGGAAHGTGPRPLADFYGAAAGLYSREGMDPADFIRKLRDEWD